MARFLLIAPAHPREVADLVIWAKAPGIGNGTQEGAMRCIIRPVAAFSARDRRMLNRWVVGVASRAPQLTPALEMRGETLIVNGDAQLGHDVALAAMVCVGHAFFYELRTLGLPRVAPDVAAVDATAG